MKYDTAYGKSDLDKTENDCFIINGKKILFTQQKDPAQLPWKDPGVDVALESTGFLKAMKKPVCICKRERKSGYFRASRATRRRKAEHRRDGDPSLGKTILIGVRRRF